MPSGGSPFIPVMQATNFGNRKNFADRLYRLRIWATKNEGEICGSNGNSKPAREVNPTSSKTIT